MAGLSAGLGLRQAPNVIARYKPEDRLVLTTPNTPETDAATIQNSRELAGDFSSGANLGARSLAAGAKAFAGQSLRTVGATDVGQNLIDQAAIDSQNAQILAPRVARLSDIKNVGDFADYAQAAAGQGVSSTLPQAAIAAGTRGLGLSAARGYAVTAGSILPSTAGEALQRINADPATANLSDVEKMAIITGEGAAGAALESVVPAAIGRRAVGAGTKIAAPTISNTVGRTVKDMGAEAATEAAQQVLGQTVQGQLNPNRDTSGDNTELVEAASAGFFGAGPTSVIGTVAENTLGKSIQASKQVPLSVGRLSKFTSPDLTNLRKPQVAPKGVNPDEWLTQDDNTRNQSATKLATVLTQAGDVSERLKNAAGNYLAGSRTEAAWEDLSGAIKSEERIQKVSEGVQTFANNIGERFKAGIATAKADLAAKQNAESIPDAFDGLLSDNLYSNSNLINGDDILNTLPDLTAGMRTWIEADFGTSDGNQVYAPEGLTKVFENPATAVTDAYNLMVRQGLVEDKPELLKQVTELLNNQTKSFKSADKIIAANILPTAQSEYNLDGDDYSIISEQIRDMLATGDIDERALDVLFGSKKDIVLEAMQPLVKPIGTINPDVDETELSTDPAPDEVNYTDSDSLTTSPTTPNTVGGKTKYSGEYDSTISTSESAAKIAEEKANTAGGQVVSRVGIVDYLRTKFGDRPEKLIEEVSKKLSRYNITSDKELNRRVFTLALTDADDSTEEIDITPDMLVSVTPGTTNNVWAVSTGRDNQYGLVTDGIIYFERTTTGKETKQFATSTAKLISHARKGRAKGAVITDKEGVADQLAMLKAGIASMLNAKNEDATPATSGRFGFVREAGQTVRWAKQKDKLPYDLKLLNNFKAGKESTADATKILTEDKAELRKFISFNKDATWSDTDIDELDRAPANRRAGLEQRRELADIVTRANIVVKKDNLDDIRAVLSDIADYEYEYRDTPENKQSAGTKMVGNEEVAISETDEMVDAAEKKLQDKVRLYDEQTGELVQPPVARKTAEQQTSDAEAKTKLNKQVKYLRELLNKGIPAFNAAVSKLTTTQKNAMRTVLSKMEEAKSPKNPIWDGNPPNDMDSFGNRARVALKLLGGDTDPPPTKPNSEKVKETSVEKPTNAPISDKEQAAIRAEIVKKLGPDITVEFVKKLLGAPRPDRAAKQISGEWTEGLIKISLGARNPAQVGAHESMHEFFSRLNKSTLRDAAKTQEILMRAASNGIIVRQMEKLLVDSPAALNQIKDVSPDFMEERLAYMYQFWHAGLLKLGPDTTSFFEKVAAFFRNITGKLSDENKAELILQAFDRGELQTADAAAELLSKNIELKERQAKEAMTVFDPVTKRLARFFYSAESSLMTTDNPYLQKIATTFKNPTGVGVEQSLIEAKTQKMAQFTNKLQDVIGDADKADLAEAVKYLHMGDGTKPKDARVLNIYTGVRKLLDELEIYMRDAKVQRMTPDGKWEDFGHIKNYYPRAYNIAAITKDPAGFIDAIMENHPAQLEAIAKSVNKDLGAEEAGMSNYEKVRRAQDNNLKTVTAQDIAKSIADRLINAMGQPDLGETEQAVGYSPYAQAINKRNLDWLDVSKLEKWMNNDLVEVMTTYIAQGTKRSETVRRFGNNSIKLTEAVDKAFEFEKARLRDDAKDTNKKITADEIEAKALTNMSGSVKDIMALEGTIGYDINPRLQRLQGTVLVYENLRTLGLSLFAQMVDPLGIMVRGGTMKEAFSTYSRGLKEIKASWTGKKIEDKDTAIAEFLGTVDSSGFLANFGQSYSSMYIHEKARRWNEALFRYNGMDGFNRATRIVATQAAISFIKRQKTSPDYNTDRYLKELLLEQKDIVIGPDGELDYTQPKLQVAIKRWVDQAILRPNAAQRPAWMSDPHFALFSHMKQFSYSFHDVILKRAWLEAKHHGELGPIGILLAGFVPIMIAADAAKAMILTGKEPYWMHGGLPSMIEHGVQRAGLLGIAQPYADPLLSGHTFSVAGPAAEQVVGLVTQPFEESAIDALPGASIINTIQGPTPPTK